MRYRYSYEKNKKHSCPSCGKKTFVRFIDNNTGEYLPNEYGRCDRESNCTYELHPVNDGYAKHIFEQEQGEDVKWASQRPVPKERPQKQKIYIPSELVARSRGNYDENVFVNNLLKTIPESVVKDTMELYQIGTSNRWKGATVFWFIDHQNRPIAGQSKLFDTTNHTVKYFDGKGQKKSCTTYITATLKFNLEKRGEAVPQWLTDYNNQDDKVTAMFGEHLLNRFPNKIIGLVEAPKTAVIASMYFPQFLWLAVGGLSYLTIDRAKVLKGRKVVLFPDISKAVQGKKTTFEKWNDKAMEFAHIAKFKVSDYLEKVATDEERNEGLDLADYLVKLDYIEFMNGTTKQTEQQAVKIESMPENLPIMATLPPVGNISSNEGKQAENEAKNEPFKSIGEAVKHYHRFYNEKTMHPDKYFEAYGTSIQGILTKIGKSGQWFRDAAMEQFKSQLN